MPGFHEAMQQYILGALCSTCQMVAKETLSQSLRLDDGKTDELVRTRLLNALDCNCNIDTVLCLFCVRRSKKIAPRGVGRLCREPTAVLTYPSPKSEPRRFYCALECPD